ncbi:hypothetical protein CF335_g8083 [Tilletia laevis]|nr:hypothetical protein CF335_g8083 [Tilletia laevis]
MEDMFRAKYPDKSIADMGVEDLLNLANDHTAELEATPRSECTFGGLKRGPDGHYDDFQLAELIENGIEEPALAFGAHSMPVALKTIDKLGQLHARNVFLACTMYLNLKPFETFLDWSSNSEVAKVAEELYVHVDNLELYPGLLADESKPHVPGSGLCPSHTVGRGILADAVSPIRSDRFLPHDLNAPGHPNRLTASSRSTLHLAPAIREIMHANKKEELYNSERPASDVAVRGIKSFQPCKNTFLNREDFPVLSGHNILEVTNNTGSIIHDRFRRRAPRPHLRAFLLW